MTLYLKAKTSQASYPKTRAWVLENGFFIEQGCVI